MRIPQALLVHEVQVRTMTGEGAYGDVHGAPWPLQCMAQGGNRLVRAPNGDQVVSSLRLFAAPGQAATIPPGSLVTWQGRESKVIDAVDHDSGGLGAPDHTEVVCE